MACPLKFGRAKKPSKIGRDFWQLSTLIANISETDPQIENRKSSWSTTTPPTLDEKKPWTLVHKRSNSWRAYWPTQVDIFRDTIFRPLGVLSQKLLHALQIGQGYLAHTPTGTGVPPKNFNSENLKFGLKFNVCTSITSRLMMGIYHHKFLSTRRVTSQGW